MLVFTVLRIRILNDVTAVTDGKSMAVQSLS